MRKLTIALCAIALTGCATFWQHADVSKIAVEVAAMKVIEAGHTTSDRADRAHRINTIATEAKTFLDQSDVTVGLLKSAVYARIASLHLQPSDQLLATALVDTLASELESKIGSGVLSPDAKVKVNTVLGWVQEACSFYG